eukprot:237904_1
MAVCCYSIGDNKVGQQLDALKASKYTHLSLVHTLQNATDIQYIKSGSGGSCYIHYRNGDLFVGGTNKYDELGVTATLLLEYIFCHWYRITTIPFDIAILIIRYTPNRVQFVSYPIWMNKPYDYTIKYISNGTASHHKFFINSNNELYGIGLNDSDQLGMAFEYDLQNDEVNDNSLVSFLRIEYFTDHHIKIKSIDCGYSHSIFLDKNGNIYSCGYSKSGALGIPNPIHPTCIQKIDIPREKIKQIACGWDHTVCCTESKKVIVFGLTDKGQCGIISYRTYYRGRGGRNTCICRPQFVQYFVDEHIEIESVSCGYAHSLCLDVSGKVYGFGNNTMHQVSGDMNRSACYVPQNIESLNGKNIKEIRCGYDHNVAKANKKVLYITKREFYLWGNNQFNQCLVYVETDSVAFPTLYKATQDFSSDSSVNILAIYPGYMETRVIAKVTPIDDKNHVSTVSE